MSSYYLINSVAEGRLVCARLRSLYYYYYRFTTTTVLYYYALLQVQRADVCSLATDATRW